MAKKDKDRDKKPKKSKAAKRAKTSRKRESDASSVLTDEILPRVAAAIPAAVAGAARRKARQKAEKRHERKARGKSRKRDRMNWAKAAMHPGQISRDDVKHVLDKGVSKADKLLESAMAWVVRIAIRAKSLYDMLSAWWHGKYDLPLGTLQALVVGLLYFVSPLDIIPDFLPFIGLADDAAVLAFVFKKIRSDLEAYAAATGKTPADLGF